MAASERLVTLTTTTTTNKQPTRKRGRPASRGGAAEERGDPKRTRTLADEHEKRGAGEMSGLIAIGKHAQSMMSPKKQRTETSGAGSSGTQGGEAANMGGRAE